MLCRIAVLVTLAAATLAVAACGSDGGDAAAGSAERIRVGLVAETSGFNDRSFNHLALVGLQRAEKELGVQGRAVSSGSVADYVPNLTALARQGYELVIAVGFQMAEAVTTVAKAFPKTKFALVDVSQASLPGKPPNVLGLVFEQQEASFLAGYLSRLFVSGAKAKFGMIGGQSVPPVRSWMSGYEAGVKHVDRGAEVLSAFSQTFADPAPCKQLAGNQLDGGAKVVFQIAGGCGIGAFEAVRRSAGTWFVGVDADQSFLGPQVLTSALKKVDVAVYQTVEATRKGTLETGTDRTFDLANDGVGLGRISSEVPASVVKRVEEAKRQIIDGKLAIEQ